MGRSKFPGKPSKLVTKKRVSVLNGVASSTFPEATNDLDTNEAAVDQTISNTAPESDIGLRATTKHKSTACSCATNTQISSGGALSPSTGAAGCSNCVGSNHISTNSRQSPLKTTTSATASIDTAATATTTSAAATSTTISTDTYKLPGCSCGIGGCSCASSQASATNDAILQQHKQHPLQSQQQQKNETQMNASEKPQPPDPPDASGDGDSGATAPTIEAASADKKAPAKKKRVSFKLETSDDVHIVKKEPIASFAPPVPIIKKERLTRAIRVALGGESILMPSRLTCLTQKFPNNAATPSSSSDTDDELNVPMNTIAGIFRPSPTPHGAGSDDDEADTDTGGDGSTIASSEKRPDADDEDERAIDETAGGKSSGEKRFVLPKRSMHSSRVIKPNKRFMDETQASTKKNGITSRKKASKAEASETRADSPLHASQQSQPSPSKSATDASSADAKDGDEVNGSDAFTMKLSDHIKNNPFAKMIDSPTFGISSKTILRQSRLQFAAPSTSSLSLMAAASASSSAAASTKESLFSSSLINVTPVNRNAIQLSNAVCGVCSAVSPAAFSHQSRKYGISSCEPCRKFMSKSVKKLAVTGENSLLGGLQCKQNDGNCPIVPTVRSSRSYKAAMKERCPACWLKKCVQSYRLPSEVRAKVVATLPPNMRQIDCMAKAFSSPFHIKMEAPDGASTSATTSKSNIFTSSLSAGRRMLPVWTKETAGTDGTEFRSFNTLSNPLAENNVKFGSSLQIVPTISEKPTIMVSTAPLSSATPLSSSSPSAAETTPKEAKTIDTKETKALQVTPPLSLATSTASTGSPKKSTPPPTASTASTAVEVEESSRLRLRKKDRDATATTTAPATVSTAAPPTTATADLAKRQRIDLKGPRVKHVCRSASIVLGQPIATFPDGSPMLDSLDTPPRPESPNGIVEFEPSTLLPVQSDKSADASKQYGDCADSTRLSPPATPIINEYDSESMKESDKSPEKSDDSSNSMSTTSTSSTTTASAATTATDGAKRDETKPMTRKLSRPSSLAASTAHNLNSKKLNSFIRKPEAPAVKAPPVISIDFWENYDPAEVSQTGFGLILSEEVPLKALCFLCGSCGQDPLIFCVCCCEPYHQYCVEDEYNLKHVPLDSANASFMETSLNGGATAVASPTNYKLNWLCPRCTVCNTCNMASGSKVKCQKCQKNYHSTCLGTSKRLSGADRALICASCLKCKSCGKTNVSKFVGNLPMCSKCFAQRQKGNYCPLCNKSYLENDYNIKMMECGPCQYWVHAKCEGLTDEQYNMLSVLPEDIAFVCKECTKKKAAADTWREAVSVEFKSGLMSVVKLLSKSRQACALLKLSPRKKPAAMCRVCVQNSMRRPTTILGAASATPDAFDDDKFDKFDEFADAAVPSSSTSSYEKCYCSASMLGSKSTTAAAVAADTSQTLLDIKQKILANKYFSLADFNYDMNIVINGAACDELQTTYKEILSEKFPWFQNETKACTDALEEDMYDSCHFGQGSPSGVDGVDQQVPMIDVPDDIDKYFYDPIGPAADTRICFFCKGSGDGASSHQSRLLYCGQNSWVHINCAMWSAEVFEEIDGSLQNVHSAIARGRLIKCSECGNKGATVGCNVRNCGEHYHFPCARTANCAFMTDKTVYCPRHLDKVNAADAKNSIETNFEVQRPVYVELDRKRRRPVSPKKVQFLIGSLHVKQLGRFVTTLSDRADAIVPADFLCTRLYWSSKEPWRIVEYTIKTSVQSNVNAAMDTGRNFTVDHSTSSSKVQIGIAQIAKWHSSLLNGDDFEALLRQERSMKLLNLAHHNEEMLEDEPQINADLLPALHVEMLPPEIEKTLFEDLPPDILDGISMLDIISNLEDMGEMDTKTEAYLSGVDLLRDNTNDDDLSQNSQRGGNGGGSVTGSCYDTDNNWPATNMHVEDAMLSARSAADILKRNKTDVLGRGGSRTHQRPWNNKIDSVISAKRRKIPRFDLRLQESVLLSIGRRKDEIASNYSDLSRPADEMKNKTFTWSAAKCFESATTAATTTVADSVSAGADTAAAKSRFKISQLDGMDDISIGGDIDFAKMNFNGRGETAIQCERCHCTYRSQDTFRRHLATCEAGVDADANELAAKASADIQNAQASQQSNMIFTSINGQDYCNIPLLQSGAGNPSIFGLNGTNLNQLTMQGQALPITSLQNAAVQMQGMFINPQQPTQQSVFAQPLTLGTNVFPTSQNGIGLQYQPQILSCTTANTSQVLTMSQAASQHQPHQPHQPQQQAQQQHQQHQQQQQNIATANFSSIKTIQTQNHQFNKNPMILPQMDKNASKKQPIAKLPASPSRGPKGRTIGIASNGTTVAVAANNAQPILKELNKSSVLMKKRNKAGQIYCSVADTMTSSQNVANIRPADTITTNAGNLVIQSAPTPTAQTQPIIVQQLAAPQPNQGNILQYVQTADGQYFAVPTTNNDYKPQPAAQYLTPNPLIPGTFQLQSSDNTGNLLLANTAAGLQVIPNGALQLAQQQQPQVIGTLIQPQATTMMAGMEQMMLGATPTFEMVANPLPGCMLLNSQPVYYGLETIVQNTVMQSQQFVSTAMQGVLSQNSSFSATTTQVFQASKIEPIMEMQPSYVVLNNDGTIMQPTAQQPLLSANLLQQALPQIQAAPANQNASAWRFIDDKSAIFQTAAQNATPQSIVSTQQTQPQSQTSTQPQQTLASAGPVLTGSERSITPHPTPKIVQPKPQQPLKQRQPKQAQKITPLDVNKASVAASCPPQPKGPRPAQAGQAAVQTRVVPREQVLSPTTASRPRLVTREPPNKLGTLKDRPAANGAIVAVTVPPSHRKPVQRTHPGGQRKPVRAETDSNVIIAAATSASDAKPKIDDHKASAVSHHAVGKSMPLIQSNSKSDATKPIISRIYQAPATTTTLPASLLQAADANDAKAPICAFDKGALSPGERESQTRKLLNGKLDATAPTSSAPAAQATGNPSIVSSTSGIVSTTTSTTDTVGSGNISSCGKVDSKNSAPDAPTKPLHQTQYTNVLTSSQAHVIQLPTAPYAPPYANGIPTNVVNPIPQYNTTRPTNRVLPMQTILPKQSPPFGIAETKATHIEGKPIQPDEVKESKVKAPPENGSSSPSANEVSAVEIKANEDVTMKIDQMDIVDFHRHPLTNFLKANDDGVSSVGDDIKMEIDLDLKMEADEVAADDDDGNSSHSVSDLCGNTTTTTTSPCGSEVMRTCTAEEAFDKLKNEDTVAMLNSSSFYGVTSTFNAVANAPRPTDSDKKLLEKQRKKISRIIDNFESEFANVEVAIATAAPLISGDDASSAAKQLADDVLDQKENMNPTQTLDNVGSATKLLKIAAKESTTPKSTGPKLLYEIQSQDGFTYKSTSITDVWEKVFEAVQIARKAHGLSPLPVGPLADMCGHQMMGLKTNALKYLLEQLPGVERCTNYKPVYHKRAESTLSQASSSGYWSDFEELKESVHGTARCERYKGRSEYDMFSWLASRHRKQPIQICVPQSIENEAIPRRGSGSNLPMAMRYRTLKETYKDSVGVYRSHIHGRGLFCNRDIEAGEMVIEYAGELIRSTLTDKRERYYDGRGIGCYMFKIDDNLVVDATMRGNAARFINHSCEPNCYSKVVDILGHKHIIIFALRRIVQGEELTYDYKFPFEETKIPCSCGSRKCRKYLN